MGHRLWLPTVAIHRLVVVEIAPSPHHWFRTVSWLTISVLQACCAVTTEYDIPRDFVRKSTASLKIKISTAQVNFSNSSQSASPIQHTVNLVFGYNFFLKVYFNVKIHADFKSVCSQTQNVERFAKSMF